MKLKSALLPSAEVYKKPSVILLIFSACFAFWYVDLWRPYNASQFKTNFVWDVYNYYSYLPAKFLNNGSFEWAKDYAGHSPVGPLGTHVPRYTYGMSVMYSPFFLLADTMISARGFEAQGFSGTFADCLRWGSFFYVLLGLFFLRKFLLFYFNEVIVTITLLAVLFGTTLFMYTFVQSEMEHGYLFCLISVFLYLTYIWHQQPRLRYTMLIAFVFGLIALIRITDSLVIIFFLAWNVRSFADLKLKADFLKKNSSHVLIILAGAVLFRIPQMVFDLNHTGQYFYTGDEHYFWNDPQVMNVLFSYRKGWLIYTPLVLMALTGLCFIPKEFPLSGVTLLIVTALLVYTLSCWWDWGYGGCFGAREFCQHIAYLSIPLAYLINFVFYSPKKYILKELVTLTAMVFIFSCICLNIGQSYQYQILGKIDFAGTTKEAYWDVFKTFQFPNGFDEKYRKELKRPDYVKIKEGMDRGK